MQKGLTLIEVLITMGISVIVGALLVVIIVNSSGLYSKESSNLQQGLNINDALLNIRQDIKQANNIVSSYIGGSTTYTSGSEQLVLKISSIDSGGNPIDETFDYFVFFKDGNNLRFKTFPDSLSSRKAQDQIFSTHVNSLNFQYLNLANPPGEVVPSVAAKVRVSLSLNQKSGAGFETQVATSEAGLRND